MNHVFSPITTPERLEEAIKYIADQAPKLPQLVLGRQLQMDTICFFAQSQQEYEFLESAIRQKGPISKFSHGATLYVDSNFEVNGLKISIFGVRKPDPNRPWVGYGDYPVNDYPQLLQDIQGNDNAKQIISGRGDSLVELRHPDLDVLGYVVAAGDHN